MNVAILQLSALVSVGAATSLASTTGDGASQVAANLAASQPVPEASNASVISPAQSQSQDTTQASISSGSGASASNSGLGTQLVYEFDSQSHKFVTRFVDLPTQPTTPDAGAASSQGKATPRAVLSMSGSRVDTIA